MDEIEEFMSGLAAKFGEQFEALDNVALDNMAELDPCDEENCPVHKRVDEEAYDPAEKIQRMYAITYVGEYAVYTDDDKDALPTSPLLLLSLMAMPNDVLSRMIGYVTKVYHVGDGPLLRQDGSIAGMVYNKVVKTVEESKLLHDQVVERLRAGGSIEDL